MQLICTSVFSYAKSRFSHEAAHLDYRCAGGFVGIDPFSHVLDHIIGF